MELKYKKRQAVQKGEDGFGTSHLRLPLRCRLRPSRCRRLRLSPARLRDGRGSDRRPSVACRGLRVEGSNKLAPTPSQPLRQESSRRDLHNALLCTVL